MRADKVHAVAGSRWARTRAWMGRGPLQIAVLLLIWEFFVRSFQIRPSILPSPTRIFLEIWRQAPELLDHASATATAALEGMILALAAGFAYAFLTVFSIRTRKIGGPVTWLLQQIPWIAFAPLLVVWLGYGTPPAAAVAFLMCFFPSAVLLQAGLHSMPAATLDIAHSMGASQSVIFRKIRLPACLPFFARALRLSVSLSFAGAAAAEFVASDTGIGYFIQYSGSRADTTGVFAALSLLVFLVLSLQFSILFCEHIWIRWPAGMPPWKSLPDPEPSCRADSARASQCRV